MKVLAPYSSSDINRTPPAGQGKGLATLPHYRGTRENVFWGGRRLPSDAADEGFYRISGVKGAGKTHLTKLFILEALVEVERNPHAKLIVYEPKREFYAWLRSLPLKSPVSYFMPSDKRSVALDFTEDYKTDQDSHTLAHAFYPHDPGERQRFWGDALRTIYAGVHIAIKRKLGRVDLRLMCLVLEDQELTRRVLGFDPYLVSALKLVEEHGGETNGKVGETSRTLQMSIHSRIDEMKVMAAHLEHARSTSGLFSIRRFIKDPGWGVLSISKDSDYGQVQDPMNGMLFLRLMQLLDKEQVDERRKVFVVIDEFPTLAGDRPCPGITDMFLRLRDRGVSLLVTYQAQTTLTRIYGETATEHIGQCTNVIYLRQADIDSANYAAEDLGRERGYEKKKSPSFGSNGVNITVNEQWYDRPFYTATELLNGLSPAHRSRGIEGRAKSAQSGPAPWPFVIPPELVDAIPRRKKDIPNYNEWEPWRQRIDQLSSMEKDAFLREEEPVLCTEPKGSFLGR